MISAYTTKMLKKKEQKKNLTLEPVQAEKCCFYMANLIPTWDMPTDKLLIERKTFISGPTLPLLGGDWS